MQPGLRTCHHFSLFQVKKRRCKKRLDCIAFCSGQMGKVQQGRPSRLSLEKGNDANPNEPYIEL